MARIYTRREFNRRKTGYLIFTSISDFLIALVGIVIIIACVVLLFTLYNWALRNGQESFTSLWKIFQDALIVPE